MKIYCLPLHSCTDYKISSVGLGIHLIQVAKSLIFYPVWSKPADFPCEHIP